MSAIFEILDKDAGGRIGRLKTPHGSVETPTVMPVINPNIQLIPPKEMRSFGAEILITNSYIIYRKEELKSVALEKGLHGLLDFDGPIMTDSGSFQLSVYGSVEVTNEEILGFQQKIGSDIIVPLDIPTPPDVHYRRAEEELAITVERLEAARKFIQGENLLAGPVQGSTYPELREKAASSLKELKFEVYPLGAVVPSNGIIQVCQNFGDGNCHPLKKGIFLQPPPVSPFLGGGPIQMDVLASCRKPPWGWGIFLWIPARHLGPPSNAQGGEGGRLNI